MHPREETRAADGQALSYNLMLYQKLGVIKLKVTDQELRELVEACIGKGARYKCQ